MIFAKNFGIHGSFPNYCTVSHLDIRQVFETCGI